MHRFWGNGAIYVRPAALFLSVSVTIPGKIDILVTKIQVK